MYLNTLGKHKLYHSLAEIVGTSEKCIKEYILENMDEINNNHYSDSSIHFMKLDKFMAYTGCKVFNQIDRIVVNHITPRKDVRSLYKEGLLTLPNVLTRDTSLAGYLKEIGFTFEFHNNCVIMKSNGEAVNINNLNFSNLHVRFGDNCSVRDFNINGYLFVDLFALDKVRGWLGSPEILKSIATAYGNRNIADNYAEHGNNYLVSFEVATDKIDLEGFAENIDSEYKTELLVRYALMALSYFEIKGKPLFRMHNPVIYLKRNYDVPGDDICKIWDLKIDRNQVIPVEHEI